MVKKTEPQLLLEDWAASSAAAQKPLPAEKTPSCQENPVPVRGKWKDHPSYQVWRNIKCRCFTPSNTDFHRYGGRGITMCERWKNFDLFVLDMGPRPSKQHTIDRKDGNGNYEPSNCCWATRQEQAEHTCRNHHVELDGHVKTVTQWAKQFNISNYIVFGRLKIGWSILDALTKPVNHKR